MKYIVLTSGATVKVDDEDFEFLNDFKWGQLGSKSGKLTYACRGVRVNGKYSKILMHRELMGNPEGKMIDHINGDKLDNQKSNLRIVDRAKNLQNSKLRSDSKGKYKGVRKVYKEGFNARIQIAPGKRLFLGYFKTEKEAALAYNEAAKKYFGEYAKLNKLED